MKLSLNLKKCMALACLFSVLNLTTINRSQAMVVGIARGSAGTAIVGVVLLFIFPVLGLILDEQTNEPKEKMLLDDHLPFLANTAESKELTDLILKKVQTNQGQVLSMNQNMVEVKLDKEEVTNILGQGNYEKHEIIQAINVLCY